MREDPTENEEKADNVQKIGTSGQPVKVLKKSINWVNKMNIIGKDCINIVLPFQNELRFVSSTFVSEKKKRDENQYLCNFLFFGFDQDRK